MTFNPTKNFKLTLIYRLCVTLLIISIASINYAFGLETIEILNYNQGAIHKQVPQECDRPDSSFYNLCYGRGMIFEVSVPPDEDNWRKTTSDQIQAFQGKMNEIGIGSNFILASLNFRFSRFQVHLTLPYLFFSGDKSKVSSKIYLTQDEARAAAGTVPTHIRKQLEEKMDQNSIEAVVARCFPNTFMPKFKELYFIFHKHTGSASADDRSKLPALAFRKFIYSHFIDETEYQEFLKNNPLSQFTQVVGNLVGYSDGCTAEEAKDDKVFSAHKLVLELALRESFLKDRKSALLLNVFGEENHENLFGQGSHGDQPVNSASKNDKGMSFCFHQSEQSLLRYLIDSDGSKDFHNEFTSLLINFTKNFLLEKIKDFRASLVLIAEDKNIALPNVAIADSLPAFEDFIKDETKGTSSSTSKDAGKVDNIAKELEVGIKENAEIYLDVVSSRYICKYCRGSFYFCQHKILARLQEILTQKGVCVNLRERNFGALHKYITTHFNLTNSQPNVRIKFLGNVTLKILATGRVAIEDKLSGKMEKSK